MKVSGMRAPLRVLGGIMCVVLSIAPVAIAANSVTMPDMEVVAGAQNVVIPVKITNDVNLAGLLIPLVIKSESGGAFPTDLALRWRERLPRTPTAPISNIVLNRQIETMGSSCNGGQPGGFASTAVYEDTLLNQVTSEPWGVLLTRVRILSPDLDPGTDAYGSIQLLINVDVSPGTFIVDTTCVDVDNHLQFVDANTYQAFVPDFESGTITVLVCECAHQGDVGPRSTGGDGFINLVDVATMASEIFLNGSPAPTDPSCPRSRSDVAPPETCGDGVVDIVDLNYLIAYAFNHGPGLCDPCVKE